MSCHKSTTVWFILPIWYWHQILRLYHVISRGFFHVKTWHGFWTSSSHGISMAFARKMMGFSSDLVSLRPKYHQNDMNKSQSHFILLSFSFQFRSWYFKSHMFQCFHSVVLSSKMALLCFIIPTRPNWTLLCGIGLVNVFNKLIPGNDYFVLLQKKKILSFILKWFRSLG